MVSCGLRIRIRIEIRTRIGIGFYSPRRHGGARRSEEAGFMVLVFNREWTRMDANFFGRDGFVCVHLRFRICL